MEEFKKYVLQKLGDKSQCFIDFSELCEKEELQEIIKFLDFDFDFRFKMENAVKELGFEIEEGNKQWIWWITKINFVNKEWREIDEEIKKELLNSASFVNGLNGETVKKGDCIIDFNGYNFSIPGEVINEDIIKINDKAIFYKSC